ncbi:MAG: nicotinate phosphoribosyltransferase [Parcubacteria group bacterium]|jgi:nicotinate phosphoribosyltransferase
MNTKKDSMLFGKADEPIITTLMEVDTYKFLMMYFIWTYVPFMRVTFAFTNRTIKVVLGDHVSVERLKEELSAVRTMRITDRIVDYLRAKGIFSEEFLADIRTIVLPEPQIIKREDGQFDITVSGIWYQVTLWETIILAIVNQLYAENVIGYDPAFQQKVIAEGEKRLLEKIATLQKTDIRFLQFGLRRRLSGWWEQHVTEMALDRMPQNIVAVSNVALADRVGVPWGGTNAHELYSGFYALRCYENNDIARYAQYEVLEKWQALYPQNLRIMLPDTFGSQQFFAGLPQELAENFRGARQDSGDPIVFGHMLIEMYRRLRIDPKTKTLLFSDGLDVTEMVRLQDAFAQMITVLFGWGTNFTNDTGFLKPISIVMKLIEAAGNPAVKLSDNLAKAMGKPEAIMMAKNIFGYTNTFTQQCVY